MPELNRVYLGDCIATMRSWPDAFIDAVVTDPPYELGFMGKAWDSTGIAYSVELWREVLRVLKPGGHLLAFSGTRTYHRMAVAIEDAGFEIRDQIQWLYGSGFPKSLNISKAIDKMNGDERPVVGKSINGVGNTDKSMHKQEGFAASREKTFDITSAASAAWDGWGTALKPANEPIVLARKPISEKNVAANVLRWGTGALNIEAGRIGLDGGTKKEKEKEKSRTCSVGGYLNAKAGEAVPGMGRWPANLIVMHHPLCEDKATAYACVPDCPMRIMDSQAGPLASGQPSGVKAGGQSNAYGNFEGGIPVTGFGDAGGASRFFYCAKPATSEREAGLEREAGVGALRDGGRGKVSKNFHPTVKPVDLMAYLIRLVTPQGGGSPRAVPGERHDGHCGREDGQSLGGH